MKHEEMGERNELEKSIGKVIDYDTELYDKTSGCNMYGDCILTA
jgi:hypothetical protein